MDKEETWKQISGFEGLYEVSNLGRVKSLERTIIRPGNYHKVVHETILRPWDCKGYEQIWLCNENGRIHKSIHVLVATAFIPNPQQKKCVDHIDGNRKNNRVDNLRWCSYKENSNFELVRKHISESIAGEKHPFWGKKGVDCHNSIPICQFTKSGVFIRSFDAIMDAYRETGISFSNISAACRGDRLTAGGFVWKYKTDTV